ncbi:hypothetical protein SAMN05444395_102331 [Flavobacterium fryxellicola]|nr:hypothetical protein [Flavobacterium fryxellicola]SHN60046.1 hypothetical protein SAMN05444395_102331 [Flavobacterium fryxellicola]
MAFVVINKGLDIGNWKDVNKDFSYKENEKIKEHSKPNISRRLKE